MTKAAQGLANGSVGLFDDQSHSYFKISADQLILERINQRNPIFSLDRLVTLVNQTLAEIKDGGNARSRHLFIGIRGEWSDR